MEALRCLVLADGKVFEEAQELPVKTGLEDPGSTLVEAEHIYRIC